MTRPGTALQAITFAVDYALSNEERSRFLHQWLKGDMWRDSREMWDSYLSWLQSDEGKKIAEQGNG